jgi:hypothetical protein
MGEEPSTYGVVEASALLTYEFGVPEVFGWQEGMRIASLAVVFVVPLVRGWQITFANIVNSVPAVGTLLFISTHADFAGIDAKLRLDGFPTASIVTVYLVDTTTGLPIDPAAVRALNPAEFFAVQLHAVTAGNTSGVAP